MALLDEKAIDGYGNSVRLYADETGTSTSGNYSSVHAELVLHVVGSVAAYNIYTNVTGSTETYSRYSSYGSGDHVLKAADYTVQHNSDGSGSTYVSGYFHSGIGNWDLGGTLNLTKINRYPILKSGTNFTDESNPVFDITAYGTFPLRVKLEAGGNAQLITRNISTKNSTTYTLELTNEERNILRGLCTSNTLTVRETVCAMSGNSEISGSHSYKDYTMTIINANPTFSNFNFVDTNPTTVALTGSTTNNVINVKGYSNIEVTIPVENKAEALKSATMNKYKFSITGNDPVYIPYSSSASVSGTINGAISGTYDVYAIDSRNNSTLVTKLATSEINYQPIYIDKQSSIIVRNDNQVGDSAILTLNGTFWNDDFGQVINSVTSITYKFKKTDSSTWITGTTIITPTITNNSFTFTGPIASDNLDTTWDLDDSYDIQGLC